MVCKHLKRHRNTVQLKVTEELAVFADSSSPFDRSGMTTAPTVDMHLFWKQVIERPQDGLNLYVILYVIYVIGPEHRHY